MNNDTCLLMAFALHGFMLITDDEFIRTRPIGGVVISIGDYIIPHYQCDTINNYYFSAINSPYSKINYFLMTSDQKMIEKFVLSKDRIIENVGRIDGES